MKAKDIRKLYLDFFKKKNHKIIESAPIVVKDDPTLMFTNAGMNQFKDIFLSNTSVKDLRVANSQKCLRVSGKHNDLDEVGHDTYHHTMFEMLGSWSFGDYFKEEAIQWAWEFLTDICKLDKDRLFVTFFKGDSSAAISKDQETVDIWKKYVSEDRILEGSKKDNFWEMGDVGPCGPCTEIHYDNRKDNERVLVPAQELINNDHPQVIEIWNIVFIQYNQSVSEGLTLLPHKHVDTGMGFERLAMIMQGVESNYDTDIFQPLINAIANKSEINYGSSEKQDIAMRVIADHVRATAFSIADGQLPSNTKAGYVIRRILRRAIRYAYTFLNIRQPFIYELLEVLIKQMDGHYPELDSQKELIQKIIRQEEESFLSTLDSGLKRINDLIENIDGDIPGEAVFELYDTFGFPVDLTSLILAEHKLRFNKEEFDACMKSQKERSKHAQKKDIGEWTIIMDDQEQEFIGYNKLEADVRITRYRKIIESDETYYQLIFNLTPFYPEGGGQIGDTGKIITSSEEIKILDTKKENKLIVHLVSDLPKQLDIIFRAVVDKNKRIMSARNHTATHLLHEVLRDILGDHVVQKGSLVDPDHLRFDFSHFSKISVEDMEKIEIEVNNRVLSNIPLIEHSNLPLKEAEDMGVVMLFGEKYEDVVRMIQFNTSKELCGGTHVAATGEIGLFKIVSESSVASGVRRIEAITGLKARKYLSDKETLINELKTSLKTNDIKKAVGDLILEKKSMQKELDKFRSANISNLEQELLSSATEINNIRCITQEVSLDGNQMKQIAYSLRKEHNLLMLLASKTANKAILSLMLTDDLIKKGLDAKNMINIIAKDIEGAGGGQSFFATAGGKNPNGIAKALETIKLLLKDQK